MRKRARALAFASVAAVMTACLFPSLDGISGGNDDAASDVAVDALEAAADAPTDGGTEASKIFSCADVDAKFCDDFDDDGSTFSRWSSAYIVNGGDAGLAPSDASPPSAAEFTTSTTAGTGPYALLHREFTGVITTSAHLAFDLRVDKYPSSTSSFFSTGSITLATANGGGIGFDIAQQGSLFQESVFLADGGAEYPTLNLTADPPLGKWVHVDVLLSFGNGLATAQVLFDGKTVLAPTNLDGRIPWGTPELTIGETYVDPQNDGVAFLTDNVMFDFQ
ncbi:MAG TPA: hypothetical protein VGH28_03105 [Polyangiaceae bacterium]|jgi:hypothetical protein